MVRKSNRCSAQIRRAEMLDVAAEAVGIFVMIPLGPGILYTAALRLEGILWLSIAFMIGLSAWLLHRIAERSYTAAIRRGRVISPTEMRYYCAVHRALEAKRK